MSSNTDDLGNPKQELPDGSALFALPHDPNKAAESIERDIAQKTESQPRDETPDPTTDADNQTLDRSEDGGPLRRFTDIKSPLGMVGLESLAKDEDEVAKAISARADEIYRNEFPVIVPKFKAKCEDCGAEFDDEDVEECRECGASALFAPDPEQRREIRTLFETINKEGQSMRQIGKITDADHSRLGVMCWVLRWTYLTGPRDVGATDVDDAQRILDREFDELVRGDPKRIVPVVDEHGRIGGVWWACPLHREESLTSDDEYADGHTACEMCGCDLREVHYAELEGAAGAQPEKFYFEHEIVMHAGHIPQAHGLDGLSPVHLVWLEQAILHWMDVYAAEYFNPHSERTPNKFLIIHTANPDAFERQLDEAKSNASENPYKNGVFYNQINPDQSASTEAQVIDTMGDEFLGQSEALRKRYEKHIRTVFGVTDVFDSEMEDAGGLNNEGLQMEVTDRSIAAAQQGYSDGPYDELLRYLGYEDWRIKFVPPREQDLEEQMQAVKLLQEAAAAGLPARMENGEPVIGDGKAEAPQQGGEGMGLGEPAGDEQADAPGDEADDGGGSGFSNAGAGQKQSPVPDNAVSIDDRNEAPEGANVVEGPRGGLYYVPGGDGDAEGEETDGDVSPPSVQEEVRDLVENGDKSELESHVSEKTGIGSVTLPDFPNDGDAVAFVSTVSYAGEVGLTENIDTLNTSAPGEAHGVYNFNENRLSIEDGVSSEDLEGLVDDGFSVGEDMEWLALHELGHAQHQTNVGTNSEIFESGLAVTREGEWVGRERVDLVDDEVSSYGRSNPGEMVAEVFAGLALGQEFPDEVMGIYDEWGGPDTWRQYQGESDE